LPCIVTDVFAHTSVTTIRAITVLTIMIWNGLDVVVQLGLKTENVEAITHIICSIGMERVTAIGLLLSMVLIRGGNEVN